MHACFIVLQLRSDSCQIHRYVMLIFPVGLSFVKIAQAAHVYVLKCRNVLEGWGLGRTCDRDVVDSTPAWGSSM